MKTIVAVCIPTYNQARYLRLAVDSALNQQGVEVEVWVSDDASPDDTAAVMAAYRMDRRVHYHRHSVNLGIAGNAGWVLTQPKTNYIVRLDSDDLLEPNYVSILAAALDAHPTAGVAHAAVTEIDETGGFRRRRELRRPAGYQSGDDALREGASGYRIAANICMFRRAALPTDFVYRSTMNFCEDWDLWLRLANAGWGNVYCAQTLASYRVWTDKAGYRAGRKLSEILGYQRVFGDTLEPAYVQRGWDQSRLVRARRRLAAGQVRALRTIPRDSADHGAVTSALRAFGGDEFGFKLRLALVRYGLGFILDGIASLNLKSKDVIKALVRSLMQLFCVNKSR